MTSGEEQSDNDQLPHADQESSRDGDRKRLSMPDNFLQRTVGDLQGRRLVNEWSSGWIGRVVEKYRLLEVVGAGSFGVVFRAERVQPFREFVAIKLLPMEGLPASHRNRFRTECQTLSDLKHAHITRIHDAGVTDDGTPFLVMEFVEGQKLDAYVRETIFDSERQDGSVGRMNCRKIASLLIPLCDALAYAHRQKIIHCDLKPDNVLVRKDGHIFVTDLGLSVRMDVPEALGSNSSWSPGTLGYAAPEVLASRSAVSHLSDIFSVGAILYRLLTGHRPYGENGLLDGLVAIARGNHDELRQRLSNVDGPLAAICEKCLKHNPSQRFQRAEDLQNRLLDYINSDSAGEDRPRPKGAEFFSSRWLRKRTALFFAGAFIPIFVGLFAVSTLRETPEMASSQREPLILTARQLIRTAVDGPGKPGAAQQSYQDLKAMVAKLDQALQEYPSDIKLMMAVGDTRYQLSTAANQTNRHAVAIAQNNAALEVFRQLAELEPENPRHLFAVFHTLHLAANRETDLARSLDLREQELQAIEALVAAQPMNLDYLDALADTIHNLAAFHLWGLGRSPDAYWPEAEDVLAAEGYLERGRAIALKTTLRPNSKPLHRKQLARSCEMKAEVSVLRENNSDAIHWLHKAIEQYQIWVRNDSHPDAQMRLVRAFLRLAEIAINCEDPELALDSLALMNAAITTLEQQCDPDFLVQLKQEVASRQMMCECGLVALGVSVSGDGSATDNAH